MTRSLYKLLRKRRNVYGFLKAPVPEKILTRLLDDATHVPSAGFTQDFDLVVVRKEKMKRKIAEACYQEKYAEMGSARKDFVSNAPVIVVPCANKERFEEKYGDAEKNARLPWWLIDAGFASLALILASFENGLAASFLGALEDHQVSDILGLPKDGSVIPLAVIPIGYNDPRERLLWKERSVKIRQRRKASYELIHWDKW